MCEEILNHLQLRYGSSAAAHVAKQRFGFVSESDGIGGGCGFDGSEQ
jgi:hypothetical protein